MSSRPVRRTATRKPTRRAQPSSAASAHDGLTFEDGGETMPPVWPLPHNPYTDEVRISLANWTEESGVGSIRKFTLSTGPWHYTKRGVPYSHNVNVAKRLIREAARAVSMGIHIAVVPRHFKDHQQVEIRFQIRTKGNRLSRHVPRAERV
jgi:hypothetical protein